MVISPPPPPENTSATTVLYSPWQRHCRATPELTPERDASPRKVQNQIEGDTKPRGVLLPRIIRLGT
jgi:hypothetical protein